MLTTVKNAFKIKEIRNKVFFTFLMLVVIRLGSQLPVPGVTGIIFPIGLRHRQGMHLIFWMHLQAVRSSICPF